MRRLSMRPVGWSRGALLLLLILPAFGLLPGGTNAADPAAAPAPQTPLVLRGADTPVPASYTMEGGTGAHIQSRVLSLPTNQANVVYLSEPVQAPLDFTDVAPYWDTPNASANSAPLDPDAVRVEIRTGPDGATWTDWQPSDLEDIVDPRNPITRTYASLVGVPQDVRTHRWAQARITLTGVPGTPPPQIANLTLSFIDAGVTRDVPVAIIEGGPAPTKPPVISRTAWGSPDGSGSPRWPPEYRRVTHIIVHHTETQNNDSDFAARVRAIWYYHAVTRGWGDIGYNYLIDPRGNVYEGRAGGDDVAAGHAYPFNYGSMGVGLLGNYDAIAPSSAMRDTLIKLLAWATDRRGIDPRGTGAFTGALNCGGTVTLVRPNIAGHRDFRGTGCGQEFNAKTCPGSYVYALLPAIRAALGTGLPPYRAAFQSSTTPQTIAPGAVVNATVVVRNSGSFTWPRGGPNPVHLGYHWYTLDGTQLTGGYTDIRTDLPQDVPYGSTVTLAAQLGAPATPGVYDLRWDMVHELKTWFAAAGSTPLTVRVTVAAQDTTPPTARVGGLPPYQGDLSFTVRWSGSDEAGGSGLASYDVQYQAGVTGAWVDWQTGTTATSAQFTGTDNVAYAFRARARDKAGNQGAYPATGDTRTTISAHPPALAILNPADGARLPPGPLDVTGSTDPGALVTVNGARATVAPDGAFTATLTLANGDVPIIADALSVSGKAARAGVVVHVGGRFRDVPPGSPAFDAIEYLTGLQVISGYDDGTFRPEAPISRAQFMKMLVTALRWPVPQPAPARFADVPAGHWAAGYIAAAVDHKVITGYAGGVFRPADNVTRAQVAKVLALAAGWPLQQSAESPFADVPLTYWAYPYIETAYRHGIVQDSRSGTYRPDAAATRAETALMLYYTLGDLAAGGRWP
jgi:hypothetical protein